ncbi:MAG: peptidylprolyl isomerase, partial [Bacteroidales bacterium]|nr:peptidylprolyl isomerase [Bacteroidales bacterium]
TAGSLTFEEAVIQYSDDPSKNNAGIIVNPNSLSSKFESSHLEPSVFFVVDKMILGEISNPVPMRTEEGLQAYRILYLKSRTEPHTANLIDDYDKIQNFALTNKQNETLQKWVNEKIKTTYINIIDDMECVFKQNWNL